MLTIVRAVDSANIDCFAWTIDALYVQFKKRGDVYAYLDVPESKFHEFREAPSLGKYFHANIKQYGGVLIAHDQAVLLGFEQNTRSEVSATEGQTCKG